jgi:hypothetical protein
MEIPPHVIVIRVTHEEDVHAERADLLVTVKGSSLVTGHTALKKAKEVSDLVAELQKCGISPEDVALESVHAEVSSGVLGKSSSANYRLRVRCNSLERIPDALGAITSARNAKLEQVIWRYPDSPEQQVKWLQHCIAIANQKAQAAARALGTRIVGIHRLTELSLAAAMAPRGAAGGSFALERTRGAAPVDLGFELSHRKTDGLQLSVEYLVEDFNPPAQ